MMSQMTEIRWHGRGGQGVVTAGELLGESAMETGNYFQAFPEYGAERMGAPIKSYTRISIDPIEIHSPILEPGVVIVTNDNLIGAVDITEGIRAGGTIIVNTDDSPQEVRDQLDYQDGEVWCVDASQIAVDEFGRDIPSTTLLGVVVKAVGIIELEALEETVRESLGSKLRPDIVEANVQAVARAYKECVKG